MSRRRTAVAALERLQQRCAVECSWRFEEIILCHLSKFYTTFTWLLFTSMMNSVFILMTLWLKVPKHHLSTHSRSELEELQQLVTESLTLVESSAILTFENFGSIFQNSDRSCKIAETCDVTSKVPPLREESWRPRNAFLLRHLHIKRWIFEESLIQNGLFFTIWNMLVLWFHCRRMQPSSCVSWGHHSNGPLLCGTSRWGGSLAKQWA